MSTQIATPVPSGLPEGLAEHRLLTSDEAALLLGVPVATLRTWRSRRRGYGPRAVQVGGSIRYRLADLLAWIDDHTENADGNVAEGIAASKRGKTSISLPSPGSDGQAAPPVPAGPPSKDQLPPADGGNPLATVELAVHEKASPHGTQPLHPGEIGKIRTEQIRPEVHTSHAATRR